MQRVPLASPCDFAEWRGTARALLLASVAPDNVRFIEPGGVDDLFAEPATPLAPVQRRPVGTVPPRFIELGEAAICHRDPERFALLYRLLWRLIKDSRLIGVRTDPDVDKLYARASAVRRDSHKMKAFVRFRRVPGEGERERYAAWFEPDHHIVERTAPFFARRFAGMDWAIVTPDRSATWDGEQLAFGPGGSKADVPAEDALEDAWRTYYASIFNPARLKVAMMQSEMPKKYWRNLPEAELIAPLIRNAREKEQEMIARAATEPPSRHLRQQARAPEPEGAEAEITSLADARAAIQGCRRCPLYEHATQAVFGEGPQSAEIMFVGEQPGDQEDLAGKPFVGPAGKVFDAAMDKIAFDRSRTYVTNAVKHFKFTPRGKRRIHNKPDAGEVQACKFWLNLELEFVKPKVVVALGATAAQSLLGRTATISKLRGEAIPYGDGQWLWVTVHPSYLLRLPDRVDAERERAQFEADLAAIQAFADGLEHPRPR